MINMHFFSMYQIYDCNWWKLNNLNLQLKIRMTLPLEKKNQISYK